MVDYDKPLGISLLTYIIWTIAIVILTFGFYVFLFEGEFWNHGLLQGLGEGVHRFVLILIFGILTITSGIGLLKTSPLMGRGLLIILCIIGCIHGIVVAISEPPRGVLVLIICVLVILYMFKSEVAAEFRTIESRKAVDAIDALDAYRKSRHWK